MSLFGLFGSADRYKSSPQQVGTQVDPSVGLDNLGLEYDIVIVGGGTAGCVLASRLTEDPATKVLLLEAGESGVKNPLSRMPATMSKLFKSKDDYNLHTVEQTHIGARSCYWPRAKMLGGCSSINAMMYHQCAPTDYDEWAKSEQDGASQWSYSNLRQYFTKFEKYTPSKQHPDVDISNHGTSGPVQVGYFGHFGTICSAFNDACVKVGIPYCADVNTPSGTLGVTKVVTYIDSSGQRVSTESAYLTPEVLKRPNLTVGTSVQVTRILCDVAGSKPKAVGVEFAGQKTGPRYRVKARKEVILCAGAVHTPQILMLSGIGPADQLKAHNIPIVRDLPGVGEHLMDHPTVPVQLKIRRGSTLNFMMTRSLSEQVRTLKALAEYKIFGTGPLTTNIGECAAFLRTTDRKLFPKDDFPEELEDSASSPNAPDVELIAAPVSFHNHGLEIVPEEDAATVIAVLLRPTSKGSIKLKSSDPFEQPAIDPNYLETKHDVDVLLRGFKVALRIVRTEPYNSYVNATGDDPFFDHDTLKKPDSVLEQEMRKRLETLYHPTSTARMAPLEEGGVVDYYLKIYGVDALRVVDCSAFPTVPAGHTSAPVIALAEKAADIIKGQLAA
ncbi:alcohol oxidase [Schizopora paradoxa]|uniref:Alcohol oxidase n=1 Tax=Schizopora paradoxa TaxID=27342 RepID=A0A0H2RHC3_9AGAM|nr:alcohol oxidase [Schizopora paradoxa]